MRTSTTTYCAVCDCGYRLSILFAPRMLSACRAATEGRILLTHDAATMPDHAYARVAASQPMSGVLLISAGAATSPIIEELVLIAECSDQEEWRDHVRYLPLR